MNSLREEQKVAQVSSKISIAAGEINDSDKDIQSSKKGLGGAAEGG
jgi:hypothetical protein